MKKPLFTRDRYCKINPQFLSNDPYRACGSGQVAKVAINKQKALDSAQKHLQKGQIDKAIVEFKKVCEADPEDLRVLQKLGDLYARQGSRHEAISTYMKLAELLTAQGFANRAVSIYKQILQLNPLLVPVYVKLSELFKELGLSKDARIFNQRAIEILQKTGNQDELLVLLKRIIEADPEDAISRITLAETYLKVGDTDSAVRELRSVLPLLREQNLDELFIRAAERLLYHNPDNVELCRELAVLHMKRNEIPRAMKLLLFCRKKDPEDVEAMELLAYHFISTGMTTKATMVLGEKAKVHRNRGETDLVVQTYRKIVEVDPTDSEARRALRELDAGAEPPPAADEAEIPIFEDSFVGTREPSVETSIVPEEAPAAAAPVAPPAAAPGGGADAVATKFIEEAEVFMKYGLIDKATEHLRSGLEKASNSTVLHEKLKDIHLDRGEMELAERELFLLAEALKESDPGKAELFLREILLIHPNQPDAASMLEALTGQRPPLQPIEEIEEIEEVEEVMPLDDIMPPAPVDALAAGGPGAGGEYDSFLDEETSDVLRPLPDLDDWEADGQGESEAESARALDAMTLPELELDDLAALETETEEIREPTGEDAGTGLDDLFPALDEPPVAAAESKPAVPPPVPPAASRAASPPPVPVPQPSSTAVEEALEEAEFFIQQGLAQEAVLYLEDLLSQYPGNRLIEDKLEELSQAPLEGDAESSPVFKPESLIAPEPVESVNADSASQITDEAFEALDAIESIIRDDSVDEEMKVGATPTEIDPSDAQTHYDLGVAYMEMEVWESAIGEFRIASTSSEMEALCYNMIGNCLVKQGRIEDAIKEYKLGLFAKKQMQDQELNLYYDIAEAYLKIDDQREAIYYLQNIKKKDPDFKDVKLKLIALSSSYKPSSRSSSLPPEKKKEPAKSDPSSAAQEVDDAFDDLFGDFGKDE